MKREDNFLSVDNALSNTILSFKGEMSALIYC